MDNTRDGTKRPRFLEGNLDGPRSVSPGREAYGQRAEDKGEDFEHKKVHTAVLIVVGWVPLSLRIPSHSTLPLEPPISRSSKATRILSHSLCRGGPTDSGAVLRDAAANRGPRSLGDTQKEVIRVQASPRANAPKRPGQTVCSQAVGCSLALTSAEQI